MGACSDSREACFLESIPSISLFNRNNSLGACFQEWDQTLYQTRLVQTYILARSFYVP